MITVLLVLQVFVTLALIGVVLIQRSEGGGLGLGTSQSMGGFMTGRGTANLLTRTTAVLAVAFMGISLTLALLYKHSTEGSGSAAILNTPPAASSKAPAKTTPKSKPAGSSMPAVPGGSGKTSSGSTSSGTTSSGSSGSNGSNVEINLPRRPADAGMGAPSSNSAPAGGQSSGGQSSGGASSNGLPIPGMSSGSSQTSPSSK